jgi:hypothetical protein
VPIVCSEYVAKEVMTATDRFKFVELDTVQVKGKTEGKKIFYPLDTTTTEAAEFERFERYSAGLTAYYEGRWEDAKTEFAHSGIMAAFVFLQRIEDVAGNLERRRTMETK